MSFMMSEEDLAELNAKLRREAVLRAESLARRVRWALADLETLHDEDVVYAAGGGTHVVIRLDEKAANDLVCRLEDLAQEGSTRCR